MLPTKKHKVTKPGAEVEKQWDVISKRFSYNETDGGIKLTHKKHAFGLQNNLFRIRKDDLLCDVNLLVDGEYIKAHKVVLAAQSPYFLAMFTTGLSESSNKIVPMESVTAAGMKAVIDIMYTGVMQINKEELQDVIIASDLLQLNELTLMASHLLALHINASNCIGMVAFGDQFHCPEIKDKALQMWKKQFVNAVQDEEILQVDSHRLKELLSLEGITLGTQGEDLILDTILRWKDYSPERDCDLENIIPIIFTKDLSSDKLNELLNHGVVKNSPVLQDIINNDLNSNRTRELSQHLYVIGGFLQSRTGPVCPKLRSVEKTGPGWSYWDDACDLPFCPSASQAFIIAGRLILFATESSLSDADVYDGVVVLEYNLIHDSWSHLGEDIVSLDVRKLVYKVFLNVGSLSYSDKQHRIYVTWPKSFMSCSVTLEDGGDFTISDTTLHSPVPPVEEDCQRVDNVILSAGDDVYSLGGALRFSLTQIEGTADFFKYNLTSQSWENYPSMAEKRAKLCAIFHDSYIYAIGGFHQFRLKSVERFNLMSQQWETLTPMERHRSHAAAAVLGGKIYICGGKSYSGNFLPSGARKVQKSCEVYDPKTKKWTSQSFMSKSRCQFAIAVL